MKKRFLKTLAASFAVLACAQSGASELVYVPINPSFGGNPLNGSILLNSAQATNRNKETTNTGSQTRQSSLQLFNETLERAILSRMASAATGELFDASGKLEPGQIETANFTVTISDLGNGMLEIATRDKLTGAFTTFQVSQ